MCTSDWLAGSSAATWLFLPIATASVDSKAIMMWRAGHSQELLVAWLIASVVFAACVRVSRSRRARWIRAAAIAVAALPIPISLFNLNARWISAQLEAPTPARWVLLSVGAAIFALLMALVLSRRREAAERARGFLSASSFLIVPFWIGVVHLQTTTSPPRPPSSSQTKAGCPDIDVLVFDELSYGAVFSSGEPSRAGLLPFVSSATVYHQALAPAIRTLPSIASYLSGLRAAHTPKGNNEPLVVQDDGSETRLREVLRVRGIFREAKMRGYRTEVLGWYFPYCQELGELADSCREFSMYNSATLEGGFSVRAPFLTLANMWPYQWPIGLVKRPAAAWLHAAEYEAINELLARASGPGPTLRWTHVNVPHRPWIAEAGTFAVNGFDPSPHRYEMQLAEVDRTLALLLERLRAGDRFDEQVTVLTSDHGARDGIVRDDPLHVPLVVRAPGQTSRRDIGTRVEVRRVLNDLVATSCDKN